MSEPIYSRPGVVREVKPSHRSRVWICHILTSQSAHRLDIREMATASLKESINDFFSGFPNCSRTTPSGYTYETAPFVGAHQRSRLDLPGLCKRARPRILGASCVSIFRAYEGGQGAKDMYV